MSNTNTGGPASPLLAEQTSDGWSWPGMTLRDYFAGKAMNAFLARDGGGFETDAESAYKAADAMLVARSA